MIKGINKNVVEIVDTGNEMFERAILFLRPQRYGRADSNEQTEHLARGYLKGLKLRRRWFPREPIWPSLLKYSLAASFGAVAAALILILTNGL